MQGLWGAVRVGLLDMRGNLRRFTLVIICLAVGTALIAGVSSVGASIRQAVERDAAQLMGGDIEVSRAEREASDHDLAIMEKFGKVARVVDTNVEAAANDHSAFVDLVAIGPGYPLLGHIDSPQLSADARPYQLLSEHDGKLGALVDPLMLNELHLKVGDTIQIGGQPFEVRGALDALPDAAVRGFRLGRPAVITTDALELLSDTTSPLPGLGTWFRYKVLLDSHDADAARAAVAKALADPTWTIRTARDGLGPMVHYYDLFMHFLVIVGLASLLIGGVSVWTSISAYVNEQSVVIAVLRSMGGDRTRIFVHFFTQIAVLAIVGVGLGLIIGGAVAALALPVVGRAIGVDLSASLQVQPLLIAACVGLLTAFAFGYLPLQQAQAISPVTLFRSKGLAAPPIDWRRLLTSPQFIPLLAAAAALFWLAVIMTSDAVLVAAFALVSAVSVVVFRLALAAIALLLDHLPEPPSNLLHNALRDISGPTSTAASVVISVGLALSMLVVVLALEVNLSHEYLGASVFDAPTFVASDLFEDEAATIAGMQKARNSNITDFTATPMLRGAVSAVNGVPVDKLTPNGPEAAFLLSGQIPVTYRTQMPSTSRLVAGSWWPSDYKGPPLVSMHEGLRSELGLKLGDVVTFTIFGDIIKARIANFRDYSWQGGIDFLVTFSPGVLESYPSTLLGAVTARQGKDDAVAKQLADALPDVRFVAIGKTLEKITAALGQLSLAATLVGGLAVGNGLLILLGSLAAGRRQRQADAVITKVLGATRSDILSVAFLHFFVLATLAAVLATPIGVALAWILTKVLLEVDFSLNTTTLAAVDIAAMLITGLLGVTTILRSLKARTAFFLRELAAE